MNYYGNDISEVNKNNAQRLIDKKLDVSGGTITSIDEDNYLVKVMLEPMGRETGWLPLGSFYAGNEFGVFALPELETEVTVVFEMGDINCGKVICCNLNNIDRPPAIKVGEILVKHKSGSFLKFYNDGSAELTAETVLKLAGGGAALARVGDTVEVSVPEYGNCSGKITSGSSKVQAG